MVGLSATVATTGTHSLPAGAQHLAFPSFTRTPSVGFLSGYPHPLWITNVVGRVVFSTLTGHNRYMSNTLTYSKTIMGNDQIIYANDNWAFVYEDAISSCPAHSEAISFWAYYPKTNGLVVQYKSSPTYYRYEGVPFATIFAMMSADSLGAFVAREVKPNYGVRA